MDARGWRTALITPARELTGESTQVAVGRVKTQRGYQTAIRVRQDGEPVVLPPQAVVELIANLRRTLDDGTRS